MLDSAKATVIYTSPTDDEGSLLDVHQLFETQLSYIVASRIDFSPSLYDKTTVKSPLYVDNSVSHMGKTTLVLKTEMKTDKSLLATVRNLQVFLDLNSKKTVELPGWWRKKHGHLCGSGEPIRFNALERPSILSRVTKVAIGQVQYSDTDPYFHVSSTNYLKYCIDAVIQGQITRNQPGTTLEPVLVKSAFTWFRKECNLGDKLVVEYWRDEIAQDTVYVDLIRDDSSVCQCILEFYDSKKKVHFDNSYYRSK